MQEPTLLVIERPDAEHLHVLRKLPAGINYTVSNNPEILARVAPGAEIILNCTGKGVLLNGIWPSLHRLQWIHSLSAGVENQLFPELISSDIPLTNARGVYKESLGEFVLAAILFFAKDLRRMLRNQERRKWDPFDVEVIDGRILGIIGYGEIGRAAARRAKALGMQTAALRRRKIPAMEEAPDLQFDSNALLELVAASDYLLVAAPLTADTRGLIGDAELRRMKASAVLINVGRGPVVNELALVNALKEKRIRGAALDVFETEPLPPDHVFWELDNVLLSPHCADHVEGWLEQSTEFFVQNFERFRRGEPLLNVVDKRAGY